MTTPPEKNQTKTTGNMQSRFGEVWTRSSRDIYWYAKIIYVPLFPMTPCNVHMAILIDLAVAMHLKGRNNPPCPQNSPFSWWDPDLHPTCGSLGPLVFIPNCMSMLTRSALFLQQYSPPILYNGERHVAPKIAHSPGGIRAPMVHGSLGPPESFNQTASQSIFHFCRADGCVQQTDRQCYINSNRLHIMLCIAMQPNNNNNKLLQYWQWKAASHIQDIASYLSKVTDIHLPNPQFGAPTRGDSRISSRCLSLSFLQCFDAVGWAAGRASGL